MKTLENNFDIAAIRFTLTTGLSHNEALAALDRIAACDVMPNALPSGLDGLKLVPIEPDLAMVIAGENYIGRHAWAKMIAAAPSNMAQVDIVAQRTPRPWPTPPPRPPKGSEVG